MDIIEIANKIKQNGGTLYLVGGAVRDELLGKENHDEDYCITGISQQEFEKLFPNAYKRGKFFCVYDMEGREFALARAEKKNGVGHKEFEIITGKEITIEQDLARRDITINSIAKNVLTGEIIDPFNGIKDIQNKIIRATTKAFKEDPLRAYRVARFASELEFNVEKNTLKMMKELRDELATLSKERVFVEFRKALESNKPSKFFDILKEADILDVHFKEIYNLIGQTQPEKYHPEGDSYNHTMLALDKSVELTDNTAIRFSVLVHDIGKGLTPKEMLPHHYGHDKNGEKIVAKFGKKIGIPNDWIKCGKTSAKEHMLGGIFHQMTSKKQVDFLTRVSKSKLGLDGLKIVVQCDRARNGEIPENIDFDIIGRKMIKEIDGEFVKKNYKIVEEKDIGELLRMERIKWLNKKKKDIENKHDLV